MTLLVLAGDIHTNGTTAPCPARLELDDGGVYLPSKPQQWLNARWAEFWADAARLKAQHVCEVVTILNGELADDNHHPTTQVISRNKSDLVRAALEVLEPVRVVSDRLYVTRGSEAHAGLNSSLDEGLAKALGAIPDAGGQHARWLFRGVVDGLRLDVAHHPGTGHMRPWTRGADANRLAAMVIDRYVGRELSVPHLIVRGHNHKPSDSYDNHPARAVILPGWQLSTSYGHRLGGDWLPVGGLILLVEGGRIVAEHKRTYHWPVGAWEEA